MHTADRTRGIDAKGVERLPQGDGGDIAASRRELQREHLNRVTSLLLRPAAASGSVGTRSLVRAEATDLLARIKAAENRGALSADARAHLKDCDETLSQALSARVLRVGV